MKKIGIPLFIFVFVFPLAAFSQWYVGITAGQYDLYEFEKSATISSRGGTDLTKYLP
jgi:hypothetical protein